MIRAAPAGDRILKLGTSTEAAALRAYAGRGAVQLIDADLESGALLLERLRPGTNLVDVADDAAISIALDVMRQLHAAPVSSELPSLAEWTSGIEAAQAAGFAPALIDRAVHLRAELLASAPMAVLLHGDLHHENILAAERAPYLAIDPKGVAGDAAYEPSVFLYNPMDRALDARTIARRVDRFAEVFERARLLGWAFVQAVLSSWWMVEDHGREDARVLAYAAALPDR